MLQGSTYNRQRFIFVGVILLCITLFFSRSGYPHVPTGINHALPRDVDPINVCSILKSKVQDLTSESSSNVWGTSFANGNLSTNNLHVNSLYYWNLLNCPKVLSMQSGNDMSESSGEDINLIVSDTTTPVEVTPTFRSTTESSRNSPDPIATITERSNNQLTSSSKSNDTTYLNQCNELKQIHHVVPGSSWGTLTTELQKVWSTMECDKLVITKELSSSSSTADISTQNLQYQPQKQKGEIDIKIQETEESGFKNHVEKERRKKVKGVTAGLPQIPQETIDWCFETKAKYHVMPMKSWGKLPLNLIDVWRQRRCDVAFTAVRMSQRPLSTCIVDASSILSSSSSTTTTTTTSTTNTNTKSKKNNIKDTASAPLPTIAIMAASTTRKIINPSPDNIALFTYMLPSLIRTIDCGYQYIHVLGYDKGDPFYDSEEGLFKVQKWFKANIELPMKANGILITLLLVKVNNTLKKPGPVFIEMARKAYDAGADYFYRINDDTEMIHNWPSIFIHTLQSLSLPYGVVGPRCDQGNDKILTHDFVHRLHMEIFEMNYYPPALVDWWMDDWISYVYGKSRTFKSNSAKVVHHTGAHGQRYEVDQANGKLLTTLLKAGRQKIRNWMLKHDVNEADLKAFDMDDATLIFTHNDVPALK